MAANLTLAEVDHLSLEQIARGLSVQLDPHKAAKVALMMLTFVRAGTEGAAKIDPGLAKVHDICDRALKAADGGAPSRLYMPGSRPV